jgi:hypothetical protein
MSRRAFLTRVLDVSTGTGRFVVIAAQGTNTILAEKVGSITVTASPHVLPALDESFPANNQISGNGCTQDQMSLTY